MPGTNRTGLSTHARASGLTRRGCSLLRLKEENWPNHSSWSPALREALVQTRCLRASVRVPPRARRRSGSGAGCGRAAAQLRAVAWGRFPPSAAVLARTGLDAPRLSAAQASRSLASRTSAAKASRRCVPQAAARGRSRCAGAALTRRPAATACRPPRAQRRPWAELLDRTAYAKPESFAEARHAAGGCACACARADGAPRARPPPGCARTSTTSK